MTVQAESAKAIRKDLKETFPTIKFSVKSSSFAGGDAVDVKWTDGPTVKEVEALTSKYEYGHFNGMEDLYEYSNCRDDLPQVKFVGTSRLLSDEFDAILRERLSSRYGIDMNDDAAVFERFADWSSTIVYRESVTTSRL